MPIEKLKIKFEKNIYFEYLHFSRLACKINNMVNLDGCPQIQQGR
jgi:hypothetical protein